jgi:hypothetical protein
MLGRDAASQIAAASVASFLQLARPVVRARARLHRHQATRGQLRAPSQELIALERPRHHASARCVHRVNLDHLLGQVNTYPHDHSSCNLVHGLPLFSFQIDSRTSILVFRHRHWKVGSPFVFAVAASTKAWLFVTVVLRC